MEKNYRADNGMFIRDKQNKFCCTLKYARILCALDIPKDYARISLKCRNRKFLVDTVVDFKRRNANRLCESWFAIYARA